MSATRKVNMRRRKNKKRNLRANQDHMMITYKLSRYRKDIKKKSVHLNTYLCHIYQRIAQLPLRKGEDANLHIQAVLIHIRKKMMMFATL